MLNYKLKTELFTICHGGHTEYIRQKEWRTFGRAFLGKVERD
jgi:hypothetical protein